MTPEQLQAIARASQAYRPIHRAIGVAKFNGWGTGIFAALSAIFAGSSVLGWVLAIGMGIIAYFEFSGARELRKLDDRAPGRLGRNQLAFAALIIAAALWGWKSGLVEQAVQSSTKDLEADSAQTLKQMLGGIDDAILAAVVLATLAVQGGTAAYYFGVRKKLRAFLEATPAWVIDLQRAGMRL